MKFLVFVFLFIGSQAAFAVGNCDGSTNLDALTCELAEIIESTPYVAVEIEKLNCWEHFMGIRCESEIRYIDLGSPGEPSTDSLCSGIIEFLPGSDDFTELDVQCD